MPEKPRPTLDCLDELLDNWCSESAFYTIAKSDLAALREKAAKWDSYVEWCEEYAEERPDPANVYRDGTYAASPPRPPEAKGIAAMNDATMTRLNDALASLWLIYECHAGVSVVAKNQIAEMLNDARAELAELRSRPTWDEVIDGVYDHECVKSYGLCDCRGEIIRELRELQKRKEADDA